MGYLLEFHALDWARLAAVIGSGDEAACAAILAAEPRVFVGSPGVNWKGALRDLVLGMRGEEIAGRGLDMAGLPGEEASPEEAMAMVAMVRALGEPVGEVIRTTRGGAKFRMMFEQDFQPAVFPRMDLLRPLLGRPFFGLSQRDFPFWGGLRKADVAALLGGRSPENLPPIGDPDYQAWLFRLCEVLSDAKDFGKDLVTLYL